MFISFVWGVFGKGGFCPGVFCPDTVQWGYHEYTGGCSVHRGVIMSTVGDTMSTLGDVQYTGGLP